MPINRRRECASQPLALPVFAANNSAGEVIIIALAGPLRAISSVTSNDVVVGSNFTTDSFTSQNSGTGKLIVLGIFTDAISVNSAGCAISVHFPCTHKDGQQCKKGHVCTP